MVATATGGHLFAFTIGPVQSLIGAARRSRDLWFGSHLLSQLMAIVMRECRRCDPGAEFIFPAHIDIDGQSPANAGFATMGSLPNKCLVRLGASADPSDLAKKLQIALYGEFDALWQKTAASVNTYATAARRREAATTILDADVAALQRAEQYLECYAAWSPLTDDIPYRRAYRDVEQRLAARKWTRTFSQADGNTRAARKSVLDGARETVLSDWVLHDNSAEARRIRRKLGIERGEALDKLGLIKRVLGRDLKFAAVARVAVAPWIATAAQLAPAELVKVENEMQQLASDTDAGAGYVASSGGYSRLPYDAQYLLNPGRIALDIADAREAGEDGVATRLGDLSTALMTLRQTLRKVAAIGEPPTYVAFIKADGDGMGKTLWQTADEAAHQALSRALVRFGDTVRQLAAAHEGVTLYSGADDALLVAPVDTALALASKLRAAFDQSLDSETLPAAGRPTLSVGIGIGHALEPMLVLRSLAAEAERLAKDGDGQDRDARAARNGLGIVIQPRGGGKIEARGRWDERHAPGQDDRADAGEDGERPLSRLTGFHARMQRWISHLTAGSLPMGLAGELEDIDRRWGDGKGTVALRRALVERTISRKNYGRGEGAGVTADLVSLLFSRIPDEDGRIGDGTVLSFEQRSVCIRRLTSELKVARWLAAHQAPSPPVLAAGETTH